MSKVPDPNVFAYMVLLLWMPLSIAAFATRPAQKAAFGLLVGAMLLLPERVAIDPPLIPELDKLSIASFWVLVGTLIWAPKTAQAAKPGRGIDLLFVALLFGNIVTSLANSDLRLADQFDLPGLSLYDGISDSLRDVFLIGIPFFVGRAYFRSPTDLTSLFRWLAIAGLLYSIPILIEVRLSPQLHTWTYGFFQHSFVQMKRGGGFRPIVFMTHGLAIAMFVATTTIATVHLARIKERVTARLPTAAIALYMFVILILCRSLGALVYGIALIPIAWMFSPRNQVRIAILFALIVVTFPLTRLTDIFPADKLVELAAEASEERAASLEFRFDNEDKTLVHAFERPWFGWGGFGRNHVYEDGEHLTVDGAWVKEISKRGLFGFFMVFGLLLVPIFTAARRLGRVPSRRDQLGLATLTLLVAVSAVELLPNSRFNFLPFILAGALHGLAIGLTSTRRPAQMEWIGG